MLAKIEQIYSGVSVASDMLTRDLFVAITGCAFMLLSVTVEAWVVEENFEGQSPGNKCAPFWNSKQDSRISYEKSSSGNKSCKFSVRKGGTGWGGGFVPPKNLIKGDEVWIRFRLFIPDGFDFNAYSDGNYLKFIRFTLANASGLTGRLDWYWGRDGENPPFRHILERDNCVSYNDCWQPFGVAGEGPTRNRWETYEVYVKFDHVSADDGGQGRVRAWKNGKLIADLTRRPTMWRDSVKGDSVLIESFMIFSYWNGGSPESQFMYFDDLVATDTAPGSTDSSGNPYIGVGDVK